MNATPSQAAVLECVMSHEDSVVYHTRKWWLDGHDVTDEVDELLKRGLLEADYTGGGACVARMARNGNN